MVVSPALISPAPIAVEGEGDGDKFVSTVLWEVIVLRCLSPGYCLVWILRIGL